MPVSINGNTGVVTGLAVGGLPDGTVDADSLASNAVTAGKLASGVGGKILQVVSTVKKDTTSVDVGSGNAYDFTAFNVAITPTSTSNKVLVLATVSVGWNSTMPFFMNLQVNGSVCTDAVGDAAGNRNRSSMGGFQGHTGGIETVNLSFVHSPASTSTQTYNIAFRHDSSQTKTLNVNRSSGDSDSNQNGRFASSLIAMEVAA